MAAIARPLTLRRLLTSEGMRAALTGLTNLPTPSPLFFQLEAELRSPRASPASVAALISKDVAMTAELLKLTNSSYFSVSGRATTALQAVRTLGLEVLEALVLRIGLFRESESAGKAAESLRSLNEYSLQIAVLAEHIAVAEGADPATAKAACCAGMLCSVGSLVLLDAYPEQYQRMLERVGPDNPLHEEEIATFGASHALIGAYLLGLWNFADPVVEAVAHSCWPSACPGHDNLVLTAVHVARALGPQYPPLQGGTPQQPALDMSYICEARKDLRVAEWRSLCARPVMEPPHA
jgi:HD-like signal output (HDOD) protein